MSARIGVAPFAVPHRRYAPGVAAVDRAYTRHVRRIGRFVTRTIRAVMLAARDSRIPKPVRWVAGVGLLPIPGPVDEVLLLLIAPVLVGFYREPMRDAWERAGDSQGIGVS